jgi:hypothetical protein
VRDGILDRLRRQIDEKLSEPAFQRGERFLDVLLPLIERWGRYFERGREQALLGLALDGVFTIPGLETLMRKLGHIRASHENAERLLRDGHSVLVYPGGAREACRPFTERNGIDFGGREGFVRLALRAAVPVVPVVARRPSQHVGS